MQSWRAKGRSALLSWCMVVTIVLLSRGFVRARAWSFHTTTPRRLTRTTRRFATDSDDDEKTPTTGWNHNQPKESSKFWEKTSERANGLGKRRPQSQASGDGSEPRTGWLHNTEPKKQETEPQPTDTGASTESTTGVSTAQKLLSQAKMKKELNHRIVAPAAFHSCGDNRQVVVTEHVISLPIFRSRPESPRLDVFFSITECVNKDNESFWQSLTPLSPQERAQAYVEQAAMETADEMILYLQGGPGFGCAAPMVGLSMTKTGSWAGAALSLYKRIVLIDQRGCGR